MAHLGSKIAYAVVYGIEVASLSLVMYFFSDLISLARAILISTSLVSTLFHFWKNYGKGDEQRKK